MAHSIFSNATTTSMHTNFTSTVSPGNSTAEATIVAVLGWLSFAVWAVSFYPQLYTNCRYKQTDGMSIDMNILSLLGYLLYCFIGGAFYCNKHFALAYSRQFHNNNLNVGLYDVVFAIHSLFVTLILNLQYLCYKPTNDRFSVPAKILSTGVGIITIVGLMSVLSLTALHNQSQVYFIYYFLVLSIVYNVIVCVKYIPQMFYFYKHKSVEGWNIWNTYFDISGGLFLMAETIVNAHRLQDITLLYSNIAKTNLILITLVCDTVIFVQYYCCYRRKNHLNDEHARALL